MTSRLGGDFQAMQYTFKIVTYAFCLCILTSFAIFLMLGMGKIDMSDTAIKSLAGVTIALISLMKSLVKQLRNGSPPDN